MVNVALGTGGRERTGWNTCYFYKSLLTLYFYSASTTCLLFSKESDFLKRSLSALGYKLMPSWWPMMGTFPMCLTTSLGS